MADDKSNRGPQDRTRIDVNEPYEVQYWTKRFGVTADELRQAVRAAGTNVSDVEAYLGKQRRAS